MIKLWGQARPPSRLTSMGVDQESALFFQVSRFANLHPILAAQYLYTCPSPIHRVSLSQHFVSFNFLGTLSVNVSGTRHPIICGAPRRLNASPPFIVASLSLHCDCDREHLIPTDAYPRHPLSIRLNSNTVQHPTIPAAQSGSASLLYQVLDAAKPSPSLAQPM